MSTILNSLFETESTQSTAAQGRGLTGTAQLTNMSANIANSIYTGISDELDAHGPEGDGDTEAHGKLVALFQASRTDNNKMDLLIANYSDLQDENIDFLKSLDEDTLDSMLKSQQSKRSRSKGKVMTRDNFLTLLTAAVAENLVRLASGKDKSSAGARRLAGSVDFTAEQMEELAIDQEKLKKEIRNVQSKKSIMKSKADFDETGERYQQLLKVEVMLKDLRVGGTTETVEVEVDYTKDALSEMLSDINIKDLHAADSKELLAKIAALIAAGGELHE